MRTLQLVGRRGTVTIMSRRCAWCSKFYRVRDVVLLALGAKVSHGICPSCVNEHFPPEPAA